MKTKRYWLRGGVIFVVLFAFVFIIAVVSLVLFDNVSFAEDSLMGSVYVLFFHTITYSSMIGVGHLDIINGPTAFFVNLLSWFCEGVLLGWVYGKIKNRNKIPQI